MRLRLGCAVTTAVRRQNRAVGKWCPGLRLCAGLPLGAPWQVAREYIVVVGRLHGLAIMANALSPCQGGVKAILVAINNRLRTGTDKGNPTV